MLTLTAKIGQVLVVGGAKPALDIRVLSIRGDKVRLGFTGVAPVDRKEVWNKKYGKEATAAFSRQVADLLIGNPPYDAKEITDADA